MTKAKIKRLVKQIAALPAEDLRELLDRLQGLGSSPAETAGVPVKPKSGPPTMSASAELEVPDREAIDAV